MKKIFAGVIVAGFSLGAFAGPVQADNGTVKEREVGSVIHWTSPGGEYCDDFENLTIYEGVTPANPSGKFTVPNDPRRTIFRIKCDGVQYTAVMNSDGDIVGNWG